VRAAVDVVRISWNATVFEHHQQAANQTRQGQFGTFLEFNIFTGDSFVWSTLPCHRPRRTLGGRRVAGGLADHKSITPAGCRLPSADRTAVPGEGVDRGIPRCCLEHLRRHLQTHQIAVDDNVCADANPASSDANHATELAIPPGR
jgi:hypothetical protein